jgi:hypothetical protein
VRFGTKGFRLVLISLVTVIALMLLPTLSNRAGNEQDISMNKPEEGAAFSLIEKSQAAVSDLLSLVEISPPFASAPSEDNRTHQAPVNLMLNPGFEQGVDGQLKNWTLFGEVDWVDDEVFSGERAVRVSANGGSSGITSAFFEVIADSRVELTAVIKAQNVAHSGGHHRLRLTVSAYQANQITRIRHWDMVALTGDTEWREFRGTIIAPPGTSYMTLTAQLTNTTGTFWIDQVSAFIVQTIPQVDLTNVSQPVIIPAPAHISAGTHRLYLDKLRIQAPTEDARFVPALLSYLDEIGVGYTSAQSTVDSMDSAVLIAGDSSLPDLDEHFRRSFPNFSWQDLGQQGYYLSVQQTGNHLQIYLGANSEQGRFYGLQTLKQLVDSERQILAPLDILDYPSLERRGIMMGLHWYNRYADAFDRMASLKLNFAWSQGSSVNDKFRFRWREPLNESEKADLQGYLDLAHASFIETYISISPKTPDLIDPPIYSSVADIQAVVSKMEDLYGLGFRRFGLSFDDLSNFGLERLYGQDVEIWGDDMGQAHLYFIEQVYNRLTHSHPDISFMVVTKNYSGIINTSASSLSYLQTLSALPIDIEIFTALEYVEEMETAAHLTGRPHVVMDNFWARFYREQKPEYVLPLDRPTEFDEGLIAGYAFLPSIPNIEDDSLVSWRTAAEYAWAPERYRVEDAFQRAAYNYLKD